MVNHKIIEYFNQNLPIIGKNILILGELPTQVLDDTVTNILLRLQDRKRNFVKSTLRWKKHFLGTNGVHLYQFKAKNTEIKLYSLFVGNISKDLTIDNMKTSIIWLRI